MINFGEKNVPEKIKQIEEKNFDLNRNKLSELTVLSPYKTIWPLCQMPPEIGLFIHVLI